MFNFTPLLGAQTTSPASQSLLEFEGGIKILVDCGWDAAFDIAQLQELERHVPSLALILLTHATPAHLAAYAHCCKHFPLFLQIPVYATQPVASLGRTLLQDLYASTPRAAAVIPPAAVNGADTSILLQPPTRDEIAAYFQRIHPLKYSQPHEPTPSSFAPPLNGLTITAYNAGHSLGGTIWHIIHGMESVVYAVDWNQVRENVFNRAAWLTSGGGAEIIEQLRKPTALICSTRGIEKMPAAGGRAKRDELLLDMIRNALARGGTVLVPTDASARVLELAYVIEHAWREQVPGGDPPPRVYLASRSIGATMRYARSMIEWMDDGMVREAEAEPKIEDGRMQRPGQNGPLDFKFIKLIERKARMEKILTKPGPKVILASDTSMDWGFARDVLIRIAADPSNLVILTEDHSLSQANTPTPGMGQILWEWYQTREHGVAGDTGRDGHSLEQVYTGGAELSYTVATRTPLKGLELNTYQQYLATQQQVQNLEGLGGEAHLENAAEVPDDAASASSSESEESDSERQGKALNYSTALSQANRKQAVGKEATGVNMLLKEPNMYDYDVRGKKGRDSLFPTTVRRKRLDEFGEVIRPEDYLRAEERDEIDGHDLKDEAQGLGQKRKWGETDLLAPKDRTLQSLKRQKSIDGELHNGVLADAGADSDTPSDESGDEGEESTLPSKLTLATNSIEVQLRIGFVDFAGLHDQRNMSLLIPLIKPRKIVLIGGSEADTRFLAQECREKLMRNASGDASDSHAPSETVFTPQNGEMVEASMDTNAWTVRLSDALVRKIHWQTVGKLDVMTLAGRLAATTLPEAPTEDARVKRQRTVKSEEPATASDNDDAAEDGPTSDDQPPTLDVLPTNLAGGTRSIAQPLHVGDLRLADLRKILMNEGHTADFRGQGTLVVDGKVAVRKSAGGRIEIESGEGMGGKPGPAGQHREMPFFAVKRRIYEGLAVIAGR